MSRMCLFMCLCMCRSVGEPRARRVRLGPRPWDAVTSGSLTLRTKTLLKRFSNSRAVCEH